MIDIFHCFFCNKLLNDKPSDDADDQYFFWCNKKCHDDYNGRVQENGRVLKEWADFMCNEGPCPKEMKHLAEQFSQKIAKRPDTKEKTMPGRRPKAASKASVFGRKKCGKCGGLGHNARTCGRIATVLPTKSVEKAAHSIGRRQYICGRCGQRGHNARTCGK